MGVLFSVFASIRVDFPLFTSRAARFYGTAGRVAHLALDNEGVKSEKLYKHNVKSYKVKCNTLDVKVIGRGEGNDMEIGLAKEAEDSDEAPLCGPCSPEKNDLDAFGKGGNGKGKSDGKCNLCGGDGHYARNCSSVLR